MSAKRLLWGLLRVCGQSMVPQGVCREKGQLGLG